MRSALLLPFALAFVVGCAAHKPAAPMQPLASPLADAQQVAVTVHLCAATEDTPECNARRAHLEYLRNAKDLSALIIAEFSDESKTGGELNTARRDHITVLAEWLTKHKYD